jgi:hypothetical protein
MRTFLSLTVCLSALSSSLHGAETTGRIFGRVTDPAGLAIRDVEIAITNRQSNRLLKVVTNNEGVYGAPKLLLGSYTVSARYSGFKVSLMEGVTLESGSNAEINFRMEVGSVNDSISVVASPTIIDTATGAQVASINELLVTRLPNASRETGLLLRLIPGAVSAATTGGGLSPNVSVNGLRQTSNIYTLNGTDASDMFNGKSSRMPPLDAIGEFSVQTNYSAEFGRGSGVSVVATTRSGTNDLHGTIYNFFRNDNLNANTFLRNSTSVVRPEGKSNLGGVSIGGPVYIPKVYNGRNKTFFFFNHQRLISPAQPYTFQRGGLTAAELAGDFSASLVIPRVTPAAAAAPNTPFGGRSGQPATDLRSLISPASVRMYRALDLPIVERSGAFTFENASRQVSEPEYTFRADHALTANSTFSFFGYYRRQRPGMQFSGQAPLVSQFTEYFHTSNFSAAHTWVIRPSIVNDMRFGRNAIDQQRATRNDEVDYSIFGIPSARLAPFQTLDIRTLTPSQFSFRFTNHKWEDRHIWDYRDTLSIVRGNHFFKAGVLYQQHDLFQLNTIQNVFNFGGSWLGNQAAEWLIGWPQSMCCISQPQLADSRKQVLQFFLQDDWKVTPRLSLNLGVRYEPQFWAYLKNGEGLLFTPFVQSTKYRNFPNGVLPIGDPALPNKSGIPHDLNNIAPRLGFAYRLDQAGKFVVRGGWGMFYDFLDSAVRDGGATNSLFPFRHSYEATYNLGYPGGDRWLNIFAYQNIPVPDFNKAVDPGSAFFNPNTSFGYYAPNSKVGFTHQWNATLEHEFRRGWLWSLTYLGHRGVDLVSPEFWNYPVRTGAGDNWNAQNVAARRPIQEYRLQERLFWGDQGVSSYQAGRASLRARLSNLTLNATYTYSAAFANIDSTFDNGAFRTRPDTLAFENARTYVDRPHNLQVNASYDLPGPRSSNLLVKLLLRDWSISPNFQVVSGAPVDLRAAQNNNYVCSSCSARPDWVSGQPAINPNWRRDPNLVYVNYAAFRQPEPGTFGNVARNIIRWPTRVLTDASVRKSFLFAEGRLRAEVSGEFFNLFNAVNFNAARSISLGAPLQATMRSSWTDPPREVQLGLRFVF